MNMPLDQTPAPKNERKSAEATTPLTPMELIMAAAAKVLEKDPKAAVEIGFQLMFYQDVKDAFLDISRKIDVSQELAQQEMLLEQDIAERERVRADERLSMDRTAHEDARALNRTLRHKLEVADVTLPALKASLNGHGAVLGG